MNIESLNKYVRFIYSKKYDGEGRKLYFASESSGSMEYRDLLKAGMIPKGVPYYQLQRNDALCNELGLHDLSDDDAIRLALMESAIGLDYAKKQLALAQYDTLVAKVRAEALAEYGFPGSPMKGEGHA